MGAININSIYKHIDEIRMFIDDNPLDVLAINKTKLDSSIPDAQVSLSGYICIRNDRTRFGDGVCIYIHNTITFSKIPELDCYDLETLSTRNPNSSPFLITACYRPPNTPDDFLDKFEEYLKLADSKYQEIYILGDMNCDTFSVPLGVHTRRFCDILNNYQLFQLINEPTRITENSETCIDLVITNKKDNVKVFGVYPLSISDHSFIYIIRKIGLSRGNPKVIVSRNLKSFDQTAFLLDLQNANWPSAIAVSDVNDFWSKWKDIFLQITSKHAPSRTVKVRNKTSP